MTRHTRDFLVVISFSLQREFLGQTADAHNKLAGLDHGLVVRSDERQVVAPQFKRQRVVLSWFEVDFREPSQPLVGRRDRGNEIADVNEHRFLAGATAGIRDRDVDRQFFVAANFSPTKFKIAVTERCITKPVTKGELRFESQVAKRCVFGFEWHVIVVDQSIWYDWKHNGYVTTWLYVSATHYGDC